MSSGEQIGKGLNLFTDETGNTIEDYPGKIDNEYLLGIDDLGGWYYDPSRETVRNYKLKGDPLEMRVGFTLDNDEFEQEYDDISELASGLVDKTILGHAIVLSSELHQNTHLTKPQSEAYSLREVYGVGRKQSAKVLGKSKNTIDIQLSDARDKAKQAYSFVEKIEKASPSQFDS